MGTKVVENYEVSAVSFVVRFREVNLPAAAKKNVM
jgi:hypothetical protein